MSRRLLLIALILACVALLVLFRFAGSALSPAAIRDLLRGLDQRTALPLAPLALIVTLAAVLVVPVIPASLLQIGSGLAFGPLWGLVYALLADVAGSAIGYAIARRWGTRSIERWLKPSTAVAVERMALRLNWQGVLLLRLLPGPAYPLVSFAAGLSSLSLATFLSASFVGVLPAMVLLVYAGDVATGSPLLAAAIVVLLVASLAVVGRVMQRLRV
jgi:uncharacterized membrane protein YdjX (TVP38/TMEM64 family)